MSDANKAVARRLYDEVLTGDNLDALEEIAAEGYVENDPLPGQGTGLQGLRDRATILTEALAPSFQLEDVIAEGDKVVVRWTNSGTHVGEFAGIPATNKAFTISGVDIYRVEGGKLAEHWHVVDQLSMLQQLGLLPLPENAGA